MDGPLYAYFPDGSPRRLAGTFRPPLKEIDAPQREAWFGAAGSRYTPEQLGAAYRAGEFDRPLYHVEGDAPT